MANSVKYCVLHILLLLLISGCNYWNNSASSAIEDDLEDMREFRITRPNKLLAFQAGDDVADLAKISGEFRFRRTLSKHLMHLGGRSTDLNSKCIEQCKKHLGSSFRFDVSTTDTFIKNGVDKEEVYANAKQHELFVSALELGWLSDSNLTERTTNALRPRTPNSIVDTLRPGDEIAVVSSEYLGVDPGFNRWVFIFRDGKVLYNLGFRNAIFIERQEEWYWESNQE